MMVHRFFAMNEKDKHMTDTARLHTVTSSNGDIQQFIYKWHGVISLMARRPTYDDLMDLFVLQFGVHLAETHEFYVECLSAPRPIGGPFSARNRKRPLQSLRGQTALLASTRYSSRP